MRTIADILMLTLCCAATASCSSGKKVMRDEFENDGRIWPLTVDAATVGCDGTSRWVEANGQRYALNGFAKQAGLPPLNPIWRVDDDMDRTLRAIGDNKPFRPRMSDRDLLAATDNLC